LPAGLRVADRELVATARHAEPRLMEKTRIEAVFPSNLTEIAGFLLTRRRTDAGGQPGRQTAAESAHSVERRLRWLLLDNPTAAAGESIGFCLRDGGGAIRGLNLCFPAAFLLGDTRILGLCSGSFFVDASMQSLGFYLFRKYLAKAGYAFYFATTCNAASASLWKQMGGLAVTGSEIEYFIPLKLDSLLARRVARRSNSRVAIETARRAGSCADYFLRFVTRPAARMAVEPCQDWEKLADLSRRHRAGGTATSERSPELLQWRYGTDSPAHPCGTYLIRDSGGNEAWFALSHARPNGGGKTSGCTLLDAIWPREQMNFRDLAPEIMQTASGAADAVFVRCRADFDFAAGWRWVLRQRLAAPRACVIAPTAVSRVTPGLLDFDDNDYVAWS
jgi:hypothetical protein